MKPQALNSNQAAPPLRHLRRYQRQCLERLRQRYRDQQGPGEVLEEIAYSRSLEEVPSVAAPSRGMRFAHDIA